MTLKLEAKIRTLLGKKSEAVRTEGKIPAVLYGHGVENKNLELDYNAFDKIFKEAGESTIISLDIDGEQVNVLIADIQFDSTSENYRHVDFHQIRMDEKVTANVEIKFIGEPIAVKELGGVFIHNVSEIEIKCLPNDLVNEIEVDISNLKTFNDTITIADLKISDKMEIIGHEENDVVATVSEPREETEEDPVVEAVGGEQPEGGEKKEGEAESATEAKEEKK